MYHPLATILDLGLRLFEEMPASPAVIRWVARRLPWVLSRPTPVGGMTRALQQLRLRETVRHVVRHSPFYQRMFDQLGLRPEDIKTLEDLQKLPFTTPADLYEWRDFLCLPLEQMAAVFTTSGTTGEPKRVYFTRRDLDVITNFAAVVLRLSFPGSLVGFLALPSGSGLWIGPGTSQRFIERAGGLALPFGSGDPHALLQWMRRFEPNLLISSPSYMTTLTRAAQQEQFTLPLVQIMLGGEPLYAEQHDFISRYWDAPVLTGYGATELGGAQTVTFQGNPGMALNDFHLITEIIDPATGAPAEEGELVFTTLRREGMPLLRYRIGDRARWVKSAANLPVSSIEILQRTDDFIIVSDMGLYGQVITNALQGLPGFLGKLELQIDRVNLTDRLTLRVEGGDALAAGAIRQCLYQLYPELHANITSGNLLFELEINADLSRQLKSMRIVDHRKNQG